MLIWHPSWIFTAFFAALFAALARNFPGRRKRQLDAIGVDRELSKGSFVAKGDARRDPDRPVRDDDGDDGDDGGDDANFVAKLEHQYHDFVDMIMYTEHVFNEVSVVLEQGLAVFTWGDERISGVLALVFFLCVFVPVAFVPPPLFYKVFFTFPYIVDPQGRRKGVTSSTGCPERRSLVRNQPNRVKKRPRLKWGTSHLCAAQVAMYPPVLEGPQPIEDYAGRVANVMNRLPAASEKVM